MSPDRLAERRVCLRGFQLSAQSITERTQNRRTAVLGENPASEYSNYLVSSKSCNEPQLPTKLGKQAKLASTTPPRGLFSIICLGCCQPGECSEPIAHSTTHSARPGPMTTCSVLPRERGRCLDATSPGDSCGQSSQQFILCSQLVPPSAGTAPEP